jgi:hypothetical protein
VIDTDERLGVETPRRSFSALTSIGWGICLAATLSTIGYLYNLGSTFGLSLDDTWNLSGLAGVTDYRAALEFVFGGVSGPLGRPIALATFLINQHSWPNSPEDLIRLNVHLHLLNAALVVWLVYRLSPYLSLTSRRSPRMALATGALWAASPVLISASLMSIQRMTLLSATFTLVGLIGYVAARERYQSQPWRALIQMALAIGVGTALGVLSKENGILLPAFALLIEKLVLSERLNPTDSLLRRFHYIFLVIPASLIASYLIFMAWQGTINGFPGRSFSLSERLLTEARILWDYLRILILPARSALGPFQDDYVVSQGLWSPPSTAFAVLGLIALAAAAYRLRRGKWKIMSFALAWFLLGHSLESTVIPLELYFEHRNYIPAIGFYIGLVFGLERLAIGWKAEAAICGLILFNFFFVLRETAISWSDPLLAGMLWQREHPNSLRAMQHLAIQLQLRGKTHEFLNLIDNASPTLAVRPDFAAVRVLAHCASAPPDAVKAALFDMEERARDKMITPAVTDAIDKLADLIEDKQCDGIAEQDLLRSLNLILENRHGGTRADTKATAHEIIARIMMRQQRIAEALAHVERAFELRPTLSDGISIAAMNVGMGRYSEAGMMLDHLQQIAPKRPFVRDRWLRTVAEMKEIVDHQKPLVLAPSEGHSAGMQ